MHPPEIDDVIAEFFAAFDNRSSRPPALDQLRKLFLPGAIIVKRIGAVSEEMTVDSFIAPRADLLTNGRLADFHEWETGSRTYVSAGLATRISSYRKAGALDGAPFTGEGVKHTSLVLTADGWRIVSLVWEDPA